MNLMGLFRSPQNELEKGGKQLKNPQEEQHEITMTFWSFRTTKIN